MKKWMLCSLGLWMATLGYAESGRVFTLTTAGDVAPGLKANARAYLQDNSGVVVEAAADLEVDVSRPLDEIGREAAEAMEDSSFAVIVLARPTEERPQGVCLPHEHFAVLNIAKLEAAGDPAKLSRRIGQEGLRVMAMLLDMSPCPFPLCVLVGYDKPEELDQMSGNFCPPCRDRFARLSAEKGLRMLSEGDEIVLSE
ncbi:MAG: hypothetical protein LBN38_05345 [Verrucomicrobiota bacterium]|jgi:hypothetical protein|nr:hypothetical protein [Verrucomicrobiota bacterium]